MEDAATEGPEVFGSAVRVGTLDSGDAPVVVAAAQKALHRLGDPREAELAEPLGELSLVANAKLGEVGAEQSLQRVDTPKNSKTAKKKVRVKDLKAKDAGRVKGGAAYLKLGDVKGEARDDDHKNWSVLAP